MTKKRQERGFSAKATRVKSFAFLGDTARKSIKLTSNKSAESDVSLQVIDELELHKIAYLSARGWVPSRLNPETGRYGWGIDFNDFSGRETWYLDINHAYECQREWDEEEKKKNA